MNKRNFVSFVWIVGLLMFLIGIVGTLSFYGMMVVTFLFSSPEIFLLLLFIGLGLLFIAEVIIK